MRLGDHGPDVAVVQRLLRLRHDGFFEPDLEVKLRTFQLQRGLHPHGVVDEETAGLLGELPSAG